MREVIVKTAIEKTELSSMKQKVATTECNLAGKMSVLFCYMTL